MLIVAGKSYRTGTTLVQRLINSTNEGFIFGENNTILNSAGQDMYWYFAQKERSLKQSVKFKEDPNNWCPNLLPNEDYYMKSIIDRFSIYNIPHKLHSGFKSLSINNHGYNVCKVFGFKLIYCIRNIDDIIASYKAMYKGYPAEDKIKEFYESSIDVELIKNDKNVFVFNYDILNKQLCIDLLEWLKLPITKIDDVLKLKLRESDDFININGNDITRPIREIVDIK